MFLICFWKSSEALMFCFSETKCFGNNVGHACAQTRRHSGKQCFLVCEALKERCLLVAYINKAVALSGFCGKNENNRPFAWATKSESSTAEWKRYLAPGMDLCSELTWESSRGLFTHVRIFDAIFVALSTPIFVVLEIQLKIARVDHPCL